MPTARFANHSHDAARPIKSVRRPTHCDSSQTQTRAETGGSGRLKVHSETRAFNQVRALTLSILTTAVQHQYDSYQRRRERLKLLCEVPQLNSKKHFLSKTYPLKSELRAPVMLYFVWQWIVMQVREDNDVLCSRAFSLTGPLWIFISFSRGPAVLSRGVPRFIQPSKTWHNWHWLEKSFKMLNNFWTADTVDMLWKQM